MFYLAGFLEVKLLSGHLQSVLKEPVYIELFRVLLCGVFLISIMLAYLKPWPNGSLHNQNLRMDLRMVAK